MPDQNQICQNGTASTHPNIQPEPANRQRSSSRWGDACGSNPTFLRARRQHVPEVHHSTAEHRRPYCKQDECSEHVDSALTFLLLKVDYHVLMTLQITAGCETSSLRIRLSKVRLHLFMISIYSTNKNACYI